jgi:hypothetical protein
VFASDEFWAQWKAVDINAWVESSGHRFTNTIHALASAIKKLQGLAAEEPSTRLYRGLGGLSVAKFASSLGFTDRALMSTTKNRGMCVFYYCRAYYKAVRVGGRGEWRTCATRDDEPRPVWTSLPIAL